MAKQSWLNETKMKRDTVKKYARFAAETEGEEGLLGPFEIAAQTRCPTRVCESLRDHRFAAMVPAKVAAHALTFREGP